MIISVLNQKGGSGKTTISINLARALSDKRYKVLLVDSDPQGSARDWSAACDESSITVIGIDRATLSRDVFKFSSLYDFIIIDGAPQLANMATSAIKCSDIIIIPVQPSPYDIWATEDLVDVIHARQNVADGKPYAAFLISRKIKNTTLGNEISNALSGYNLPILKNGTSQRVVYAKTAALGHTVFDSSNDKEAMNEMILISEELLSIVKTMKLGNLSNESSESW